jgi:glycosyltransferase involved in cell wall biosynthesis
VPNISIIIATCSRPTDLEKTLLSLTSVRVPDGWSVELLLVESGVQSGAQALLPTIPYACFRTIKYLFEPLRGKSRALNSALTNATGDILLFSDDDVRFPVDWIEAMCKPIVAGRADATAGGVSLAPHLLRPWMNHTHRAWLASTADYLSPENPSEMCGANMAVCRQVFEQIGGFDVELGPGIKGGGEESLLSWQIKQAGFKLVGCLEVQVEHHLNSDRLQYKNWIQAASLKGQMRAYLLYHWKHSCIRFPLAKHLYYQTKLFVRRMN